jgi:hypothetical protein
VGTSATIAFELTGLWIIDPAGAVW